MSGANGDSLDCLVGYSMAENRENAVRALHNATAKTDDLLPYRNDALCALVDGVDRILTPND